LAILFVPFGAFTTKKSITGKLWFEFTGEEVTLCALRVPANYVFARATVAPCNNSEQICAIYYEGTVLGISSALATDENFKARLEAVLQGYTDVDIVERSIE
jgi:hypothetical protein